MSQQHTVLAGECLHSIAKLYGFTNYQMIYNHSSNAALRRKRPDPNVLFAGDIVVIPNKKEKSDPRATSQAHKFVVKRADIPFRLHLTINDKPRANEPYEMVIDDISISGRTDGAGWITMTIAPDAKEGKLFLPASKEEYLLELGHLDPVEEDSGVMGRLQNLGYYSGSLDGPLDAMAQKAILNFQESRGLPTTGTADASTKAALRSAYGS